MVNNLSFYRNVTRLIVSHQDTIAVKNVSSPCVGNSNLPPTQKGKRKEKLMPKGWTIPKSSISTSPPFSWPQGTDLYQDSHALCLLVGFYQWKPLSEFMEARKSNQCNCSFARSPKLANILHPKVNTTFTEILYTTSSFQVLETIPSPCCLRPRGWCHLGCY